MGVSRHGVPDRTRFELGQTHLELAGAFLEDIVDDQLVDDAVVAVLHLTCGEAVGLKGTLAAVDGDELGLVLLVGGCRVDVEVGGLSRILALEDDVLLATAYIEGVLEVEFIVLAVNGHDAVTSDVDNTELPAEQEIRSLERIDGLELQGLGCGNSTTEDETVIHRVCEVDLVIDHDLVHHECLAKPLGVITLDILGIAGSLDLVVDLSGYTQGCKNCHNSED